MEMDVSVSAYCVVQFPTSGQGWDSRLDETTLPRTDVAVDVGVPSLLGGRGTPISCCRRLQVSQQPDDWWPASSCRSNVQMVWRLSITVMNDDTSKLTKYRRSPLWEFYYPVYCAILCSAYLDHLACHGHSMAGREVASAKCVNYINQTNTSTIRSDSLQAIYHLPHLLCYDLLRGSFSVQ